MALKRKGSFAKKRKRLKPRSKKVQDLQYSAVREEFINELGDDKTCQPGLAETGCYGNNPGGQIHHMAGRVGCDHEGIPLLISKKYFLWCCYGCHEFIERNNTFAVEHGYSIRPTKELSRWKSL